jgi:hypothetical protein
MNFEYGQSQVNGRSANITPAFLAASVIYLFFCAVYLLVSGFYNNDPALSIIHIGSAVSLFVFWKYVRWGVGRYDTFGSALLLIYAMFKIQAAIDTLVYGTRIDEIYRTVPLPDDLTWLFLKSEALNNFGILLLVAVWRRTVGGQVGEFSFLNNRHQISSLFPWLVYLAAIFVELARRVAGQDFGVMAQISSLTYQFGVVSIFFIASAFPNRYKALLLALLLASPLSILALDSGMKSQMIFPLVPSALIFWFHFRSYTLKFTAVSVGFILLSYSQLYVHYVREETWGDRRVSVSTGRLIEGFQTYLDKTTLFSGMDSVSSRMNMTTSRAITVAIADSRGFEPYTVFGSIPASFIPRFLWPGKPVLQPGAEQTKRILNTRTPISEINSATAAGFFSELYLGGGLVGWVLGLATYGYLLARIQLITLRRSPGFGHLALSFVTVYWALRFEENATAYAYTGLFFSFVYLMLLAKSGGVLEATQRRLRPVLRVIGRI